MHFLRQQLYFFDGDSERLFTKNVLAGGEGLERSRDMKWVGDRDDDRIHARVCQHVVIVEVNALCAVELAELLCQGFIGVTDRAEKNVASLLRGFQVGELRDGATAQYAYAETVLIFQHCALSVMPSLVSLPGKSILGAQRAATRASRLIPSNARKFV